MVLRHTQTVPVSGNSPHSSHKKPNQPVVKETNSSLLRRLSVALNIKKSNSSTSNSFIHDYRTVYSGIKVFPTYRVRAQITIYEHPKSQCFEILSQNVENESILNRLYIKDCDIYSILKQREVMSKGQSHSDQQIADSILALMDMYTSKDQRQSVECYRLNTQTLQREAFSIPKPATLNPADGQHTISTLTSTSPKELPLHAESEKPAPMLQKMKSQPSVMDMLKSFANINNYNNNTNFNSEHTMTGESGQDESQGPKVLRSTSRGGKYGPRKFRKLASDDRLHLPNHFTVTKMLTAASDLRKAVALKKQKSKVYAATPEKTDTVSFNEN
mmetsp:Transcript_7494/g.11129  ORF Transcript_7494/g.11129 Transcript_7494/m.11129 type:complete len:330 (-) Transcript_7494:176-1165(-)